jgi:hypothetical protein
MPGPELPPELSDRIDGRVDVAAEPRLGGGQRAGDFRERDFADHEDVDITASTEFAAGGGPEDQRHANAILQRSQGLTDRRQHTHGLVEQGAKFREDRALLVNLEVHVPSFHAATDDSGVDE